MKRQTWIWGSFSLVFLCCLAVGFMACDNESASNRITVEPPYVRLHKGESVTFTASGGYDYFWTLSDNALGRLNTRNGPRVIYTSFSTASSSGAVQTVSVNATIAGESVGGSTGTTANAYSQSAEAVITHY